MVRKVKSALDEKSRRIGRGLYLSVRVPPSIANDLAVGIDVSNWIRNRVVDIVVVGDPANWNYRLPIEQFCRAGPEEPAARSSRRTSALSKRIAAGRRKCCLAERDYYTTEQFRAVAARHWQAGADGIYIWNQQWLKFTQDTHYDYQSWKEIGSPAVLARKNKDYIVGPAGRGGSLPNDLANAGDRAEITVEIADDLVQAKRDGVLRSAVLRMMIEQYTSLDHLTVTLNGTPIDLAAGKKKLQNYNDTWIDCDCRGGHPPRQEPAARPSLRPKSACDRSADDSSRGCADLLSRPGVATELAGKRISSAMSAPLRGRMAKLLAEGGAQMEGRAEAESLGQFRQRVG